jgi:hypothetical protein
MAIRSDNGDYWDWDEAAQAIAQLPLESIQRIFDYVLMHWVDAGRDPEALLAIVAEAIDR